MSQIVDLKVGFSCNNHCIHCVVSDKINESDLTLNEIKALIDNYINTYGEIQLTLTGGEVTIREDFIELLSFIKGKKDTGRITFVDMQTNARMLSNEDKLYAALGVVDFYLVALHSDIPEVHDKITRVKGSFSQTTRAIKQIVKNAGTKKIAIQTVISRENYQRLPYVYKFSHERFGITEFNITFPHPIGICFDRNIVPSYQEVQPYVNLSLYYCVSNGIYPYVEALPPCVFEPKLRDYVLKFLENTCMDVVGYAGEKDGEIDYGALFSSGHKKYNSCLKCKYNKICDGVWKEHVLLYPDEDMLQLMSFEEV